MRGVAEVLPLGFAGEREELIAGWASVPVARRPLEALAPVAGKVGGRTSKRALRRRLRRIQDPELRDRALARLDLARYLPRIDGRLSEFVTSQGHWLKRVNKAIEASGKRADAQRNLKAVAWEVAIRAGWIDHTARVSWDTTAAAAGVCRRTIGNELQWLRENGWLGHVEHGTTPKLRKRWQNERYGDQNRQPVYLLCEPLSASVTPQEPLADVHSPTGPTGAQNDGQQLSTGTTTCTPTFSFPWSSKKTPHTREGRLAWCPRTKTERQQAAGQIQDRSGANWHTDRNRAKPTDVLVVSPLRTISKAALAHLARDFWRAGWTVDDVLHAIDHRPDGTRHTATSAVSDPAGWIRYRLNHWRDADNDPVPSIRQRRIAANDRRNADQDAFHAAAAARDAARVPLEASQVRDTYRAIKHAIKLRKHGAS